MGNLLGGYTLTAQKLYRWSGGVDVIVSNRATEHVAVQLWAASTLEDMYGAPKGSGITGDPKKRRLVGRCRSKDWWVSRSMQSRRSIVTDRTDWHARFTFSLADLDPPMLDDEVCYLAVQQVGLDGIPMEVGTGAAKGPLLGYTLVMPPVSFEGLLAPNIHLRGLAPTGTGAQAGIPFSATTDFSQLKTPMPLSIALTDQTLVILRAFGEGLLYSFDWGMPTMPIDPGVPLNPSTSAKYVLVASSGAKPVEFAIDSGSFYSITGSG